MRSTDDIRRDLREAERELLRAQQDVLSATCGEFELTRLEREWDLARDRVRELRAELEQAREQ